MKQPLNGLAVTIRVLLFGLCIAGMAALFMWKERMPLCPGCNVVVISLDQVRAKSLPCFGYSQNTMPNLCGLAAKSATFTKAYATASRTLDSHFSMLTALYPSSHRMNLPYVGSLNRKILTMPEHFRSLGYATYFLGPVADPHLPVTRGIERGFDKILYADDPASWTETMQSIDAQESASRKPTFYFLHTYEAHEPFIPPEPIFRRFYDGQASITLSYDGLCDYSYRKLVELHPERFTSAHKPTDTCEAIGDYAAAYADTFKEFDDTYSIFNEKYWSLFNGLSSLERKRYVHALYAGALFALDTHLGEFFTYLGRSGKLDNTVIVIVGDQGDEFWEHNDYSHGWSLYNEVLRVPFIVYVPKQRAFVSDKLISLIDIYPTVSRIVGGGNATNIAGIDVFSMRQHRAVLAEHVTNGATAVIARTHKIIERREQDGRQVELFNLTHDPQETDNLYGENSVWADRILEKFRQVRPATYGDDSPEALPTWMDENDRQELIDSGYF